MEVEDRPSLVPLVIPVATGNVVAVDVRDQARN
jgi:hypothetical protein